MAPTETVPLGARRPGDGGPSPERLPIVRCDDGVRVTLRVTPRASADRIRGVAVDANGVARLQVSVTAAPEDGKANAGVIKLLSRAWRMPKSALALVSGPASRHKTLLVRGDPGTVAEQLGNWFHPTRE